MLNDNLHLIVMIAAVGLVALVLSYVITTKEQNDKAKDTRLKWLKEQTSHTLNALILLKQADCKSEITEKLHQHGMSLVEEITLLAPDSELMQEANQLKERADRAMPDMNTFHSDRAIKKAQIYINFAEKLVIQMAKGGKITSQLAGNYQQELYWLSTSIVADAHMSQGKTAKEAGDLPKALSHLKHAKAVLIGAMVNQQKKKVKLDIVQAMLDEIQPKRPKSVGTLADSLDDFLKKS